MLRVQILKILPNEAIVGLSPNRVGNVTPWTSEDTELVNSLTDRIKKWVKLYSVNLESRERFIKEGEFLFLEIVPLGRVRPSFDGEGNITTELNKDRHKIKIKTFN